VVLITTKLEKCFLFVKQLYKVHANVFDVV